MVIDNHRKKVPPEKNRSGGENAGVYRPPQARMQQSQPPHRDNPTKVRRPDRAVYVPKAKRQSELPLTQTNRTETPAVASSFDCNTIERENIKKPRSSKSRKTVDKNYCNVYQPPHARISSLCDSNVASKNVRLELSESPPRAEFSVIQQEVPHKTILNDIVPISEQSPLPLMLGCSIETANSPASQNNQSIIISKSQIDGCVAHSELEEDSFAGVCEDRNDDSVNLLESEKKIKTKSCELPENEFSSESTFNDMKNIATDLCLENVTSSASPASADIEHSHNITANPPECLNLNVLEKSDNNSHSVNNYYIELENNVKIIAQNSNDEVLSKSPDADIILEKEKVLYNMSSDDVIRNPDENIWDCEKDEDKEQKELMKATEEINRSNRKLIKQSFANDILLISTQNNQNCLSSEVQSVKNNDNEVNNQKQSGKSYNPNEEDWEAMFDENGEWLEPDLVEELTAAVGKVAVQKPKISYSNYLETAPKGFSHVLEVYNFPSEFTNNDLLNVFSDFKDSGFEIKWVDDNHALAVFSSAEIAAQVLAYNHPMVKTRPLYEATHESRAKAKKSAEFLKPYKPRPETCTALARRLVSGALGVKLPTQAQERLQEKEKIFLAKEKKRLAALHREAAWDGSLTSDL